MSENSSQRDIIEIDLLLNLFNTSSKDIVIVNFVVSNMYKIYRNIYIGDYWRLVLKRQEIGRDTRLLSLKKRRITKSTTANIVFVVYRYKK